MSELFDMDDVRMLSPRLQWMKDYNVTINRTREGKFIASRKHHQKFHVADTEEEACEDCRKFHDLPIWTL